MYDQYYLPYYNKLLAIQAEKDVRSSELMIILGDEGAETAPDEPVLGVKQYIERAQEEIRGALDLETYLGHDLWVEFSSYRREDEYSNDNFISDGLTDSELVDQALQFIDKAKKEIYKSANLQHTITATLKNLLIIPAFAPIVDYFSVGNWIRVKVDGAVYRLRLVSYDLDYSDMDSLSVEFSDVTKTLSGTADVADILSRASSMASTFDYVTKQAVKGSDASGVLSNWTENGLSATHTKIIDSADNQNMVVDQHGTLYRKFDPMTEKYEDIQMKIINSTIAITDDNWKSTRAALGRFFYVNPKTGEYTEGYGINGEVLCGKLLLGESLGIYNSDNSLRFDADGLTVTNGTNTVSIDPNGDSVLSIVSENGTVISFNEDGTANFTGNVNATSLSTGGKNSIASTNDGTYIAKDGSIYVGGNNGVKILSDGTFNFGNDALVWDGSTLTISGYSKDANAPVNVLLSREYIGVPCDNSGVPSSLEGCSCKLSVIKGLKDVSDKCSITYVCSGCSGSFDNSNNTFTLTELTNEIASVTFTVKYNDNIYEKVLTINKVLQGKDGVSGKDAITLSVTSSASPVITGNIINTTLTAHVYMGGKELSSSEISVLGEIKWYKGEDAASVGEGLTLIVNTELSGSEITFTARLESDD